MPARVAILHQGFVPLYRVRFFELLHERGQVEYVVFHGQAPSGRGHREAEGELRFAHRRVENRELTIAGRTIMHQPVVSEILGGAYDGLVLGTEVKFSSSLALFAGARAAGLPVLLWGQGFEKEEDIAGAAARLASAGTELKRGMARMADGYLAYTQGGADRLRADGIPADRITVVRNTIDVRGEARLHARLQSTPPESLRAELGLRPDSAVVVFTGRAYSEKRLPELIDAARIIRDRGLSPVPVEIVVIGDGPDLADARRRAEGLDGVHFLGRVDDAERIGRYLRVATCVAILGKVGLAVNHAFAHGLPIVTRASRLHAAEIEYIDPGRNGLIVDGDLEAYAAALASLAANRAARDALAAGALATRETLSLEAMADRYDAAVVRALERRGRRVPETTPDAARAALRDLEAWGASRDWIGTDPYDGLLATRVPGPIARHSMARRLLTQGVKRSIVDVRPLLGIEPGENAAALAWVVSAYAIGGFLEPGEEERRLRAVLDRLERLRSTDFPEPSWGYHFPLETRLFGKPAGAPNTIATTYAGMALLDAYERLRDPALLELAVGTGHFFTRRVPQTEDPPGAFFGYWPDETKPVHNANLHVCGLLARLSTHVDEEAFAVAARQGVRYGVSRQHDDGSWPYGETPGTEWVDNFHTGYVLDSLRICLDAGIDEGAAAAWERGLEFYRRELFLPDGTPRYFHDQTYPVDSQCLAQAIQTLAIAAEHVPGAAADAWRVYEYGMRRMRRDDGAFMFQRRRLWANRAPHMRGTVASMLLALAHLNAMAKGRGDLADVPAVPAAL